MLKCPCDEAILRDAANLAEILKNCGTAAAERTLRRVPKRRTILKPGRKQYYGRMGSGWQYWLNEGTERGAEECRGDEGEGRLAQCGGGGGEIGFGGYGGSDRALDGCWSFGDDLD